MSLTATQIITTTGPFTWYAPLGVSAVAIILNGGCGGGGDTDEIDNGGGGGGGASVSVPAYVVVPKTGYSGVIGAGGARGVADISHDGVNSSFDSNLIVALGGGGGHYGNGGPGAGGTGGDAGACTVPVGGSATSGSNGAAGDAGGVGGDDAVGSGKGGDGGIAPNTVPTAGSNGSISLTYVLPNPTKSQYPNMAISLGLGL